MDLVDALTYFGFLALGYVLGALRPFFADWLTDWRRQRQADQERGGEFREIREKMPALLEEMQEDLEEDPHVREFIVLDKRTIQFGHQKPRFEYYRDEHDGLDGKLTILENHGFIQRLPHPSTPMYRLSEEFVDRLSSI